MDDGRLPRRPQLVLCPLIINGYLSLTLTLSFCGFNPDRCTVGQNGDNVVFRFIETATHSVFSINLLSGYRLWRMDGDNDVVRNGTYYTAAVDEPSAVTNWVQCEGFSDDENTDVDDGGRPDGYQRFRDDAYGRPDGYQRFRDDAYGRPDGYQRFRDDAYGRPDGYQRFRDDAYGRPDGYQRFRDDAYGRPDGYQRFRDDAYGRPDGYQRFRDDDDQRDAYQRFHDIALGRWMAYHRFSEAVLRRRDGYQRADDRRERADDDDDDGPAAYGDHNYTRYR